MVAQYADGCNFGDPARAQHLLGVLNGHCESVGRDPAEITKTAMISIAIAETESGVETKLDDARGGVPSSGWPPPRPEHPRRSSSAHMHSRDVGIEGLTCTMGDVHDLEALTIAGETLAPVFNPKG